MKMNSNSNNYREMFWDESNRLRVVYDQNSYQMQHYIYDAAGERTLKASSKIENVYENGQVDANTTTMGLYTTYVSPYMVVDANQKYSKHYFNGTQRVASKIGEQDIAIFENGNQYLKQADSKTAENTPSIDFEALKTKQITDFSYYVSKSTNNATAKNVKVNYSEYKRADTNTETASAKAADNNSAFAAPQYAEIYYYHSDHLGTGTFLSDFEGNPYQFFLNLPFGETMAEQHSYSGEYTNRYKFNGKELDEETGFYYYGARYYNPKFSIWLSVDEKFEKYPFASPYNYCLQNPINAIDPDGRDIIFLNDSAAVHNLGHASVLIGNDKDGWRYLSMNGTGKGQSAVGDSKNADLGDTKVRWDAKKKKWIGNDFRGSGLTAQQVMNAVNTSNVEETHQYDRAVRIKSTLAEDEIAYNAAKKQAAGKTYGLLGSSCIDVPQEAFSAVLANRIGQKKLSLFQENIYGFDELIPNVWYRAFSLYMFEINFDIKVNRAIDIIDSNTKTFEYHASPRDF